MAYQRFVPSFVPSRFEAQAMLIERQEETRLLQLQLVEEQNQRSDAFRAEIGERFFNLEAMMKNHCNQASISPIRPHEINFSPSIIPITPSQSPRPPFPPPDPPDIRKSRQELTIKAPDLPDFNQSELISATQIPNKRTLRYSCEEIHERMTKGLCIFCEDLDSPGHYNLKHKRSKLCLVECVDDRLPDAELVEPAVEISNKSVNMIQGGESNPENESRPAVSVSQFQVPLSSMEPSRRCCNDSLDVVDERMCNELVCEEDGDPIITMSAKFRGTYEGPQFELMCLKQSHDSVENYLDSFGYALTRSSLQHTPTNQYRAPFSPYQNYSDQSRNKSEFGNSNGPEIEFDRESEEIEDDELQDKQPEDEVFVVDVETLDMTEDKQPLECDDEIVFVGEESDLVTVEEIVVSSVLKPPTTFTCMRVLGHYKIMKMYILIDPGDATSGNNIQTSHKCVDLENWSPPLEDDFYGIKSQQQHMNNRKVILRFVIPVIVERVVKREKDYDGALLAPLDDTVAFSNLDAQQIRKQQLDPLLMLIRMIVVPFSTLILMTCKVLELIKDKASKKRKLCKSWWFKYKLNTWLSEAFHFWKYKKQINQGQICLNGLCNELVYGIEKKKLMNVEGDIMKDKKLDHNLIALILQICCCIGGLSASGFEMETWTVKKSLEWLKKLTIAISLAQMFLDHVCKLQGTPQDMLSDRDPTFLIELFRVLRAGLSSDTTYEFILVQPHPVHFPFRLEETLFAVVMDITFLKKEELIPMSKVHLSQGQNNAATKALVQWKEHPPDQATWEFYQDLVAKYLEFFSLEDKSVLHRGVL